MHIASEALFSKADLSVEFAVAGVLHRVELRIA